jgi:hypothetical protein
VGSNAMHCGSLSTLLKNIPPRCPQTSTKLHGITFQKAILSICSGFINLAELCLTSEVKQEHT